MKLKLRYFIRGLGIGIVFTAIIMSISLQASRSRIIRESALSKEEIIEKAKSYGLNLAEENSDTQNQETTEPVVNNSDDTNSTDTDSNKEKDLDDDKKQEDQSDTKEESNKEESKKDSDGNKKETSDNKADDDSKNTELNGESNKKANDSKDKENSVVSIDYVKFTVERGMTAQSVSEALLKKGIIDDKKEFQTYLSEQGYAQKIQLGEYLIPVDATYKKIARIITRKD